MDRIAIIGLENSGKSTLFNALGKTKSTTAIHPFSTNTTCSSIVEVQDPRLDELARLNSSKKIVRASFELLDVARTRDQITGDLSPSYFALLKELDAFLIVLRHFKDDSISGNSDPLSSLETIQTELILSDLASCENQLKRLEKSGRKQTNAQKLISLLEKLIEILSRSTPLYNANFDNEEKELLKQLFLLTAKPVFFAINVNEENINQSADSLEPNLAKAIGSHQSIILCAKLEEEIEQLSDDLKKEMLNAYNLDEPISSVITRLCFSVLGKQTFFTSGEKETRAWPFRKGAKAPECAGVIHSDLERGFIKAQVISYEDFVNEKSFQNAKSHGKLRLEGKDYVVKEGDILEIRFNV